MQQLCLGHSVKAHDGFVRGVTMSMDGRHAFSCGDDKAAKMWKIKERSYQISEQPEVRLRGFKVYGHEMCEASYHMAYIPGVVWRCLKQDFLEAIDHHWRKPMFVTVGDTAPRRNKDPLRLHLMFPWQTRQVYGAMPRP